MRPSILLFALGLPCLLGSCDQIKQKLADALSDPPKAEPAAPTDGAAAPSGETPPTTQSAAQPSAPAAAQPAVEPEAPADGPVRELKEAEYADFIATPGRVVVVDFHAEWCGPCRQLGPILAAIATESGGDVIVGKFNVDHCKGLAQQEGVRGIPDVRIYRNGQKYDAFVGAPPERMVRERIAAQVSLLKAPAAPPKPTPKPAPKPAAPAPAPAAAAPQAPAAPAKPAEPAPMPKDWLPPGMQRK